MYYNVEDLRFLKPDGDFIFSPEGHLHFEVIKEQRLSDKDGFEALLELILSGFALIAVSNNQILITHTVDMSDSQLESINRLTIENKSYAVCILREDVA